MSRALLLSICLVAGSLVGCTTLDDSYGYSKPHVPRVAMPENLDRNEHRLLPEIQDVLEDAGYRITSGGDADYYLDFSVEVGPLNADVWMKLFQGRREVAGAYARSGGARTLFRREQRIRNAFEKCLHEFEAQIPQLGRGSPRGSREWSDHYGPARQRESYNRRSYDEEYDDEESERVNR